MDQKIVLLRKQRKRTSWRQRIHLVEALHANLDIAKATADLGIRANAKVIAFWTKLTDELNNMGLTCNRKPMEWKHVWTAWCRKLRWKCRRISASLQKIDLDQDGRVSTDERLDEVEMKILEIISRNEIDVYTDSGISNQNEKQNPRSSTNCPSGSTDYGSFPYQFENREEEMASAKSRKRTRVDIVTAPKSIKVECRVCLQYVFLINQCCDIFDPWYQDPSATIVGYFTQLTNIQVSEADRHTKYICFECLSLLRGCVRFVEKARNSEAELEKRYELPFKHHTEPLWPKPIQVDKCLNNNSCMEVEVKQEVLSEEDVPAMDMDNEELGIDIKVEPEEYASYCSPQIMDTISQDETVNNSDINRFEDESYFEERIKDEPLSDNESEATPDLPLDCMLCTKAFHSVSGLKAHVIAQHSYLTIARRTKVPPRIYQCFTCRRTFTTHTDLIVHETCHGQYACYMCNSKFETFVLLSKHSKSCMNNGDHVSRLKTLEDVKRPSPEPQNTKLADSTNTELESQITQDGKVTDSTNTEESRYMIQLIQKSHGICTIHIQKNTELKSQKICQAETSDSTELELHTIHCAKAEDFTNTKSKAINSTNTESQSQKIHNAKLADSTNVNIKSQKIEDLSNTESPPLSNDQINVTCVLDCHQIVETIYENSSQDSNSSKTNDPVTEEINADSKASNLHIVTNNNQSSNNNTNSEMNNSNSVLDNSNSTRCSEKIDPNVESTTQNPDLETKIPMSDSPIEISSESHDFNLTLNSSDDTNNDLNTPVPETNIEKVISSDRSPRQSLNTNSASPKLVDGITEVDSCNVNVVLSNDLVSTSKNIAAESNDLATDVNVSDSNLESFVEINTGQSQTECANITLKISEHSKKNTPNLAVENDSMKIHLAIHSLEKKSLDKLKVKIDEEVIETKESSEDKVLQ